MRRISFLTAVLLAACAHEAPRAPEIAPVAQYTSGPLTVQGLVPGKDIPAQWWTLFQSPALDQLVRQALDNSPTLARANAKLRQAQEDRETRAGATQWPRVDARLAANRVDIEPQSIGAQQLPFETPFNLFLASVGVSYTFDLFGATRRELEGLGANIDYQRYELEAARLALAGNVVTAAIREASIREQIAAAEQIVAVQERRLAIVEQLGRLGTASQGDVAAQRQELAQARVLVPELKKQLEQVRHRLAVYVGRAPGSAELPQFRLADLQLPAELPVSLPSELARQRPDIRAAEALLQVAGAKVGVATANLYPQITLSANLGSIATHAGDLFGSGTAFYLLGASLTQPLFRGGELESKRRSAVAAYDQAAAAYQEAVLQGFQNVADVLRALEADASKVQERSDAAAQARRSYEIASARFKSGGLSQYALLDSERRYQSALLDQSQAIADRHADSAALLQALGGGWWR